MYRLIETYLNVSLSKLLDSAKVLQQFLNLLQEFLKIYNKLVDNVLVTYANYNTKSITKTLLNIPSNYFNLENYVLTDETDFFVFPSLRIINKIINGTVEILLGENLTVFFGNEKQDKITVKRTSRLNYETEHNVGKYTQDDNLDTKADIQVKVISNVGYVVLKENVFLIKNLSTETKIEANIVILYT